MLLKVKSSLFIDHLSFELEKAQKGILKAILRDDRGSVCRALETELSQEQRVLDWEGLNELPYGVYTLEILGGPDEMKMKLVKRV
jgi:hypothetical protein